eukprot:8227969-Karenia_brevis.AAC.1
MGVLERLRCYKGLLRSTAARARDLLIQSGDLVQARDAKFATLSRVVVQNNVQLAQLLLSHSPEAKVHIGIQNDRVFLHDPVQFGREVDRLRSSVLQNQIQDSEAAFGVDNAIQGAGDTKNRKSCARRVNFLQGLLKLWLPVGKKYAILSIVDDQNQT